jgi:hypothetical protein
MKEKVERYLWLEKAAVTKDATHDEDREEEMGGMVRGERVTYISRRMA